MRTGGGGCRLAAEGAGELVGQRAGGRCNRAGAGLRGNRTGRGRCGLAELELLQQRVQRVGFLSQRMACRRLLFDHGSILLRALIHIVDGGVDLLQADRLFARRGDDRADMAVYLLDLAHDLGKRFAGFTDKRDAGVDMVA